MRDANPDPEEGRNFVFTVTTPTLPLTSSQYLLKLIQNHTNYQVIPAPLMLNYDADEMVMTALPLSKNKLLDLTLPLIIADSTGNEMNYLGRYLMYDQRLVGIRLSSSRKEQNYGNGQFKKWKFGRISRYRVSKCISDYYKKQRFAEESYSNDIPIGDFTLTIGDIKVCMLFQSEIEDSQATLIEYKRQGCEIFSVVNDVPRDQVFQATMNITNAKLSTKNENMFRRFIRQNNRLMIYAGARIATKESLFLANSFIIHPELPEKCIEPFFFNDGVTLSVLCNVQLFKRPGARRQKFSESKTKPELHIQANLLSISTKPGKSIKFYANEQIEQTLFAKAHGDLLKKMKLWFIYQIDNQRTPFIIPIPLSEKMEEIVTQLQKLSLYLGKPLSSILILYKKSKEIIASEELEESLGVELYEDFDNLCLKCKHEHLNIYTDDHSHYLLLTSRVENYKRVRLHYDYLKFHDDNGDRKVQVERISKMNDFASYVIKKRIIGYQRLLIESRSQEWRLTKDEQVQAIAIYLKSKLRSQVNSHPFYKNILFRSTEEIRAAMIEAEAKLANSQTSMADESLFENPPADQEASVEYDEKDFGNKLKEMRKLQSKQQKKSTIRCHKCNCFYERSLLHRCSVCRTEICFICMQDKQEKEAKTKKELIETVKCLVCRKLCNCSECLNKDKPDLSREIAVPIQIMEISNRSQTLNDQQTEKQAIEYRDYCTVCLINQRKSTKIKVSCSTCDRQECLACIRSERKNTTITLEWQCSICKPYVEPPIEPMISEDDKGMEVQEPARKPSKSKSVSRSGSPPKKTFAPRRQPFNNSNDNNNRQNNNNNNFKNNWNQNRQNNNFNKGNNNTNANDDKKSRSVSRSGSPVRKPANKANQQKKSASRSNSPKRNVQNNKKNQAQRSPSRSYSKSPPRVRNQPAKVAEKKKSPSRSNSPVTPPRSTQKQKPKSPPRSASKSKSPVRTNNNKANERKRSKSRSVTPPRKPVQKKKSKSRSVSKSKSPPRKAPAAQQRKKSVSRSGSPPKDRKNAKNSVSISRSKSRQRSRDDNKNRNNNNARNNQPQPEKLWNNDKPRENKWNNNNDGNNNYNRDRNQNYQNNRGGYQGNRGRGGYQGNYNRNNDRNNNQGDDGNRRYNNNYNNRDSNRDNNRDNSRNNNSGENENNHLLSVSNFEVNNDVDY